MSTKQIRRLRFGTIKNANFNYDHQRHESGTRRKYAEDTSAVMNDREVEETDTRRSLPSYQLNILNYFSLLMDSSSPQEKCTT